MRINHARVATPRPPAPQSKAKAADLRPVPNRRNESSFEAAKPAINEAARKAKKRAAEAAETASLAAIPQSDPSFAGPAAGLSEEAAAKVGTGFGPQGPLQAVWSEKSMLYPRAREQGLLTPAQDAQLNDFANQALPGSEKKEFTDSELGQMASQLGIPPEKMDPNQLGQAARFVSEGTSPQNQRERIAMAMANLTMVANDKLPVLQKSDAAWMAQELARVPGKSFNDVKGDVNAEFQKIAGALNTPGESKFKVGKYNVTTVVSETGKLESTKAKKPGLFSKLGDFVKKIGPKVLMVASFIPGPIGIAARIGQAAISVVKGIKSGSFFQAAIGVASGVAAGAGAFLGKAAAGVAGAATKVATGVAATTARIAGAVANGLRGLQAGILAVKTGNLGAAFGAVASIAGAAAAGIGTAAGVAGQVAGAATRVAKLASGAQAAVNAYHSVKAGDVFGAASSALSAGSSIASGTNHASLAAQFANAKEFVDTTRLVRDAVKNKDYFGAAASVATFASTQLTGDPKTQQRLALAGSVFTGAGKAQAAIKSKDWFAAASAGLGIGADLTHNGDLKDGALVVGSAGKLHSAIKTGSFDQIVQSAHDFGTDVKGSVERFKENHFPPEILAANDDGVLKLTIRDLGPLGAPRLLAGATPASPALEFGAVNLGPTPRTAPVSGSSLPFSADVQIAQSLLNQRLGTSLTLDGKLGPQTQEALKRFQVSVRLPVTGQYDPRTQHALETGEGPTESEVAAARGEPPVPPGADPVQWKKQAAEAAKWGAKLEKLYIDIGAEGAPGTTLTGLYAIQSALKGVKEAFNGDATKASIYLAQAAGGALKFGADLAKARYAGVIKDLERTPVTEQFARDFLADFDKLKGLGRVLAAPANAFMFLESAKKALTGTGLDGDPKKSVDSGIPLLDVINRANLVRGTIAQGKYFLPELAKAVDFALAGIPGEVKGRLGTILSERVTRMMQTQSAEQVGLYLQKLSMSRLGPVIESTIAAGGSLSSAVTKWAGPLGIAFDVTKTFLELLAPQINAARVGLKVGIDAQANGGGYDALQRQVNAQFADPLDAQASFRGTKFFRDQFLSGGSGAFAGAGRADFERLIQTRPDVYRLYREKHLVHSAQVEAQLVTDLKQLATEFLARRRIVFNEQDKKVSNGRRD